MSIENDNKNSIHWEISEEDFRNAKIDCFVLEGEEKMLVGLRYGKDKSNTRVFALAKGDFKKDRGLIREVAKAFQKLIINPTLEQINDQSGTKGKSVNIDDISLEEIAQMCGGDLEVTKQCQILMDKLKSGDFDVFKNGEKLAIEKSHEYKDNHLYEVESKPIDNEIGVKNSVDVKEQKGFEAYWIFLRELRKNNEVLYNKIKTGNRVLDSTIKFEILREAIKTEEITTQEKAKAVEDYLNTIVDFEISSILKFLKASNNPEDRGRAAYYKGIQLGDEDYIFKIQALFDTAKVKSSQFKRKYQDEIKIYEGIVKKFEINSRLESFETQWQQEVKKIKLGEKFSIDNKKLQVAQEKYEEQLKEAKEDGPDRED